MWRWLIASLVLGHYATGGTVLSADEPLWQQLLPRKQVEAEPDADYSLGELQGPWLVLAASFSGPEGENEARDLVLELRRDHQLPAYYFGMTFEMDRLAGRGIDTNGARITRRYKRGNRIVEHAVLVGEFPTIDDPEAQQVLKKIKHLKPECMSKNEGQLSSQSLAAVRRFHRYLRRQLGSTGEKGPLSHAFVTRNPLLPREYFVPQGVDEEIAKWNEGLDYSLMKCPGKYSIRVATFRGRSEFQSKSGETNQFRTRKAAEDDPLVVAGKNAHLLTVALREKGWEAYEFHDRHESYVTVGSFDDGKTLPDGRIVLTSQDAQTIVDTFGAVTPNNVFNRPAPQDQRLEQIQKQRFQNLFASQQGAVAQGFHPKRFVGLPMDIHPQPVLVPLRSLSSTYARN